MTPERDGDAAAPPLAVDVHEPEPLRELLAERGVPVDVRKLHPGDYVAGSVGVERKTVRDFYQSLTSKRLFEQVTRLADTYPRPFLLLEGDLQAAEEFKNTEAFFGAYVALTLDYGVPVLHAASREESARLLALLWRRALREPGGGDGVRFKPRRLSPADEQKFVLQGLPNVGGVLSERMLERFGTLRRAFQASEAELKRVPLMGEKRARRITELLDRPFEGPQRRLGP